MSDDLLALSPLDGRYLHETESLRDYFSELAYIRDRVRIEIAYLIALSRDAHLVRELTSAELNSLNALADSFSLDDAHQIKALERTTRHDVKAIENFLRARLEATSLSDLREFVHFGLTSEDANNIASASALRHARDLVILPALDKVLEQLLSLVERYKATPMLANTHGQPAVPTTFGKEMAVFYARLREQRSFLSSHRFEAKLNGAVGNFNALAAAAPQVDWIAFSEKFIRALGLEPNLLTTQILPYDNWVIYFNTLHLTNSIMIGLAQDVWRYLADGDLKLKVVASEVGSSVMPQKVNPIDFENAEGNLGVANSLLEQYARKLPISRLQRDLSDSTVRRTFGAALGHSLVAYASLANGLERVEVDEAAMRSGLEAHWETVAEGAQTMLRLAGFNEAYDQLKSITRGKGITKESLDQWIAALPVDESVKRKLRALSPRTYVGLAEAMAERILKENRLR
ncbi:MAG TPA: adenylosuccinate lyase [Anaerolineales bacterium]|nr:adenylosuccinate lyase [Anaerolineales bacterium]